MAAQVLSDAEMLPRSVMATALNPNRSVSWPATALYPSWLSDPLVTSVLCALIPNTFSASSSLAMQISTYGIYCAIVRPAFSLVQRFLRKFRSQLTVSPAARAALHASITHSATFSPRAGVMPVKWNQVAPAKIFSQSKSSRLDVEIEDNLRSYTTFDGRWEAPFSRK